MSSMLGTSSLLFLRVHSSCCLPGLQNIRFILAFPATNAICRLQLELLQRHLTIIPHNSEPKYNTKKNRRSRYVTCYALITKQTLTAHATCCRRPRSINAKSRYKSASVLVGRERGACRATDSGAKTCFSISLRFSMAKAKLEY